VQDVGILRFKIGKPNNINTNYEDENKGGLPSIIMTLFKNYKQPTKTQKV
jgi:hypothetical protein